MLYVGVDVAVAKPMDIVVLGDDRGIKEVEQRRGHDKVAEFIESLGEEIWVAVDAPRWLNTGRMANESFRSSLSHPPRKGKYLNCRFVEYELGRRRLPCYFTPAGELTSGKKWMQEGFDLYDTLEDARFEDFVNQLDLPDRLMMEYYPHASFTALSARYPGKKGTSEGRETRLDTLADYGVPLEDLAYLTTDGLDALAGAVTAHALRHSKQRHILGDEEEGYMVLPKGLPEDCSS